MLFTVSDLTIRFGGLTAVDQVSFGVGEREIFSLIGPNGAGKSTVFNAVTRFVTPVAGSIQFDGREVLKLASHDAVRLGIARTFQNPELFRGLTVLDTLLVGAHTRFSKGFFPKLLMLPSVIREERLMREKARHVLDRLGIGAYGEELVTNLPYGIQKLVDIGRALISEPKLLLLDEPAAGLNSAEAGDLGQVLRNLRDELGITILLVEHNMALVMSISDRACVLASGRRIAEGTPAEVAANAAVIEAYLGEVHERAAATS